MFRISDLSFFINIREDKQIPRFMQYKSCTTAFDVRVSVKKSKWIFRERGKFIFNEDSAWYKTLSGQTIELYEDGLLIAQMKADSNWQSCNIKYMKEKNYTGYSVVESLICLIFRNLILHHNGLVLHSSAMKYKDQGIVFSAASGTGKTTHTTMWEKHKGAEIINDDTPAIRMFEDNVYVYGTPWSGSSTKFTNDKLPLKAIVLLEQYPTNEMVQLTPKEAVSRLMPRVFLPYQDEALMKLAIDNVSELIARVPIYLLKCTPEVEAMELVASCLEL